MGKEIKRDKRIPPGVSRWKEEGKKYGYWEFFEQDVCEQIETALLTVADAGEYEDLRREVKRYFNARFLNSIMR